MSIQNKTTLLQQHQDVLGSGLVVQVLGGVSAEKHTRSASNPEKAPTPPPPLRAPGPCYPALT